MRYIVFLALFVVQVTTSNAQQDSIIKYRHTVPNLHYFGSYFTDMGHTAVAPMKWKQKDWMVYGAIGATTLLIMTNDLWVQQTVTTNTNGISKWVTKNMLEPAGNYQYVLGTAAVFYSLGLIKGEDKHKRAALLSVKSYLVSGALVQVLKRVGSRRRPYQFNGDPNPYTWEWFEFDYHSFPSGHTTAAFTLATVFATMYSDVPVIGVIAYSIATLTGLSRIHDNAHWASDVFAGAALGWGIGRFMVKHDRKRIKTIPYVDNYSAGLSMQYTF